MQELKLPHLLQTCQAVFAVEEVEECPHDRTSLFDHSSLVGCVCFRLSSQIYKMVSSDRTNGFVVASSTKYLHGSV